MSVELQEYLQAYPWPGNVRELRNEMERMRLMNSDKLDYTLQDIDPKYRRSAGDRAGSGSRFPLPAAPHGPPEMEDPMFQQFDRALRQGRSPLRRRETVKRLFVRFEKLTRAEILKGLKVSEKIATADLKALQKEGFIRKIMPTRSPRTHYFAIVDRL